MKKIKVLFMALLLVGATFSSYKAYQAYTTSQSDLLMQNIEALANDEAGADSNGILERCLSGGKGAIACSHHGSIGVEVVGTGGSVEVNCSITCDKGYYACCKASGCCCIPY